MAAATIIWGDKVSLEVSPEADVNVVRDADMNAVKAASNNHASLIDTNVANIATNTANIAENSFVKVGTTTTTAASTPGTFQAISGSAGYANNTTIDAEIHLLGIIAGGTVGVTAKRRGFFRKDNVGVWTVDFQEALVTSDILILADAKLDINGGFPGITFDTGINGANFELDRFIKIRTISL